MYEHSVRTRSRELYRDIGIHSSTVARTSKERPDIVNSRTSTDESAVCRWVCAFFLQVSSLENVQASVIKAGSESELQIVELAGVMQLDVIVPHFSLPSTPIQDLGCIPRHSTRIHGILHYWTLWAVKFLKTHRFGLLYDSGLETCRSKDLLVPRLHKSGN